MNFAAYRDIPAINWSSLKWAQVSWRHFDYFMSHDTEDTSAMRLGRLVHLVTLQPESVDDAYAVWPGTRRAKGFQAFAAEVAAEDMEVVTDAEMEHAQAIADSVRSHHEARRLLQGSTKEQTLTWADPATDVLCKCRVDIIKTGVLSDLKTTDSEWTERGIQNTVYSFGYHAQLAHYLSGCVVSRRLIKQPVDVSIIFAQKKPPHDVGVFQLTEDALYCGKETVDELLRGFIDHVRNDAWPGRFPEATPLDLPDWYYAAGEAVMEATL
jgi:hypothetical protein